MALIIYDDDKHVHTKGMPCHGPHDKKAAGTRAMFAPYISEDLRFRVLSLLYVGVSVETIMQRHNESVEKQGGPCNPDDRPFNPPVCSETGKEYLTFYLWTGCRWCSQHQNVGWKPPGSCFLLWRFLWFRTFHFGHSNRVAVATNDSIWQLHPSGFWFKVWSKQIKGLFLFCCFIVYLKFM